MTDKSIYKPNLYRSQLSGEPLTLRNARIAIVGSGELDSKPRFRGIVSPAKLDDPDDRSAIEEINSFYWDSIEQDVFGRTYNIFKCNNFIARPSPDEPDAVDSSCHGIAGHVAVAEEEEGFLHIVVFSVWPQWHGRGVGKKLLDKIIEVAKRRDFPTIKLGTTNDNLRALYFYQRRGFVIEKVIPGEVVRTHGCEMIGFAGIKVRDEIQMRLDL